MELFGIDIGGSGIKGAPVNIHTGELVAERHRIPTPQPSRPQAVAEVVRELLAHFNWRGPVGCGFPTVIHNGRAKAHSNLHDSWTGVQVDELFEEYCGLPFHVINDADAAGIAEMTFGAGSGKKGLVMVITIGTGIGSGVFYDGRLIPSFELGHLLYKDGRSIEKYASSAARKRDGLSYEEWGHRFNEFLQHINRLFSPDLVILGGGTSKKIDQYIHTLTADIPIEVAHTRNEAGIIGAAMAAQALIH